MEFAIALATSTNSWKVVKRAEELGFSHAWFYDTQLLCADVYAVMALAAHNTSTIKLGTGVAIPSNRLSAVTASAFATLNELAPGRIIFGVGTGFTGRRTMGMNAIKLKDLEDYVNEVYGLLAGDIVETTIEGKKRKIRLLNPEAGLINTRDKIDLHVSAMGPKARLTCARMNAGWLNFIADTDVANADLENMRSDWVEAGNTDDLHSTAFAIGRVLDDGEAYDSEKAMAQAGPLCAVAFHNYVEMEERGSLFPFDPRLADTLAKYRELYQSYEPADARYLNLHAGHLIYVRDDEKSLITADHIRNMTFTGTVEQLCDKVAAVRDGGYDQLAIQIVQGHEDAIEDWAEVFKRM